MGFTGRCHCVKRARLRSFSGRRDTDYLSVFSPNAGKYEPEKLRIRTMFLKCAQKGLHKMDHYELSFTPLKMSSIWTGNSEMLCNINVL